MGRRAFVVVASAVLGTAAIDAACETFEETPADPGADASADGTNVTDGTPGGDGAGPSADAIAGDAGTDAPAGACEVLLGQPFAKVEANVLTLAADGAHVYWGTTQGASRQPVTAGGGVEVVQNGLGTCTHIVVGGDFFAARFGNGSLRVKSKLDIAADASVPNLSGNSTGMDPRSASQFFVTRVDATYSCNSNSTACAEIMDHPNIGGISNGGAAGLDFIAAYGTLAGIFHCASNCNIADSGALLATASQSSSKIVSDADFVYFLDRSAGVLRRISRVGGVPVDVVTGLDEPIDVEIDSMGRFVVATLTKGVFRGPKTGCAAPATQPGASLGALAVYNTTVWYAEGADIKRFGP